MKVFLYIITPSIVIYLFWVTYRYFNRTVPDDGSKESIDRLYKNDHEDFI